MREFRWIEWNRNKVAKHGVSELEAERIVCNAKRPYPQKDRNGKGKWEVVGRGIGDRLVEVVYVIDDDHTLFIIHAMPLTNRGRRG